MRAGLESRWGRRQGGAALADTRFLEPCAHQVARARADDADASDHRQRLRPLLWTAPVAVSSVEFSHNGQVLAVLLVDGHVHVLDTATGQEHAVWAEFSPSAPMHAVAGSDGKVRLWDPNTGALLREIPVSGAALYVARFSPDGARIAAAGVDGAVTL